MNVSTHGKLNLGPDPTQGTHLLPRRHYGLLLPAIHGGGPANGGIMPSSYLSRVELPVWLAQKSSSPQTYPYGLIQDIPEELLQSYTVSARLQQGPWKEPQDTDGVPNPLHIYQKKEMPIKTQSLISQ